MQKCKYADVVNCKACNVAFYKECKNFQMAHISFLSRKIKPFKLVKVSTSSNVVWSKDQNKAKSAAVHFALKFNSEVIKLTLSQVISLTISNEEIEGKVFYIDCSMKVTGDVEKVSGVLKSFVDKASFSGSCVSVYVAPCVVLNLTELSKL